MSNARGMPGGGGHVEASISPTHNRIYICPEHFTDNIERKYFRFALKLRLYNKMIYSKQIIVLGRAGGALPYKEANGDVPLDGVAFSRLD